LATSQRGNFMAKGKDVIYNHQNTQQSIASALGFGMSISQAKRNRAQLLLEYPNILEKYLQRISNQSEFQLILFDDDYTHGWSKKYFNKAADAANFMKRLTVNAVDIAVGVQAEVTALPLSVMDVTITEATKNFIVDKADFRYGYLHWFEENFNLQTRDYTNHKDFTIAQMRKAWISYKYGAQTLAEHARTQRNATLLDINDRPFKSYVDQGSSMLTPLFNKTIWDGLAKGPIPSIGDFPKFSMQNMLLNQHFYGAKHFIEIMKQCGNISFNSA